MKISELEDTELDDLVATAENPMRDKITVDFRMVMANSKTWNPSVDWSQGGPIIEREKIHLLYCGEKKLWFAAPRLECDISDYHGEACIDLSFCQSGVTALVAAMRCYVASKFGDEIKERKSA